MPAFETAITRREALRLSGLNAMASSGPPLA